MSTFRIVTVENILQERRHELFIFAHALYEDVFSSRGSRPYWMINRTYMRLAGFDAARRAQVESAAAKGAR